MMKWYHVVSLGAFVVWSVTMIKNDHTVIRQQEIVTRVEPSEIVLEPVSQEIIVPIREDDECSLTEAQIDSVRFSYHYGQPYDFGYTLAAIALKESNAGKWKINIHDPSGGLYHVTLDKVIKINGWEDTPFNRNRAMQLLVDNDKIAARIAIEELQMWKEHSSGNWLSTWASYNHGWNGLNTERGQLYAQEIRELIQKIQYCRWI
jgi:hypothetical protein